MLSGWNDALRGPFSVEEEEKEKEEEEEREEVGFIPRCEACVPGRILTH